MRFLLPVIVVSLVACSTSTTGTGDDADTERVALDADAFCARVDECNVDSITNDQCLLAFGSLLVTKACRDAIDAASCEELTADGADVEETCFPKCSGSGSCDGETITRCNKGRAYVGSCDALCKASGKAETGECTDTSEGVKCACK